MRTRIIHRFRRGSGAGRWPSSAGSASAQQIDTNPPLPNVLLLVDNSGSMERMIDGNTPETDANPLNCVDNGPNRAATCAAWTGTPAPAPPRRTAGASSRRRSTGSLPNGYNCVAMARTSGSTFGTEYQINGQSAYDASYYMPYHRLVAEDTSQRHARCVRRRPGSAHGAPTGQGVGPTGAGFTGPLATDFTGGMLVRASTGSFLTPRVRQPDQRPVVGFAQNTDGVLTRCTTSCASA